MQNHEIEYFHLLKKKVALTLKQTYPAVDDQDAMAKGAEEALPSKSRWHARLTAGLRDAQTALAEAVIHRKAEHFEVLLSSQSVTFFLYVWWRQLRSGVSGKRFNPGHGEHFQNES